MLFCLGGFHATVAYSSLSLINMLYAFSLTLGVAGWRVRFRRPSVLAHCDVVVCMCFYHDSFESIVMPSCCRRCLLYCGC